MKELTIKKIAAKEVQAAQVPELLNREAVGFQAIDTVNWADFPYQPKVEFRVAHTGENLLVHYRVTEKSVRAVAPHDMGHVWEDACCEFFVQPGEEPFYYNFECNCAGTLLIEYGKVGNREHAPQSVADSVQRWASLGREPFEERLGECSWELALVIPATALFKENIKDFSGLTLRGNFYKCGDMLQTPHFLSWSPIDLPKPMFHCPEFFGTLHLEG